MKRTVTLLGICLLALPLSGFCQAAKGPQWKSRAEYDAYHDITNAASPQAKIQAVDAFLEKFPSSEFKALANILKAQAYQQMGQTSHAIASAKDALKADPNNLPALNYLSFVFPYTYKPNGSDGATELTDMQSQAKQGLELLQQQRPPQGASAEQFEAAVKVYRFDFNRALGFAALQQKDSAGAISYLKAATGDNPGDSYTFYFLGQAYLGSNPADYNNGIWNLARSVALAKKANDPILSAAQKAYSQWYEYRHGSNAGEDDLISQASSAAEAPAGFNVAPPKTHAKTGNATVDAFYSWEDTLSAGGDTAQSAWSQIKGQPYEVLAYVESVQPGADPSAYNVRATIIPDDKGRQGMYNLILQTNQEDAKYLKLGDPFTFKGAISAYTETPSFVLTISNVEIDPKVLQAAAAAAKSGPKPAPPRRRRRR